MGLIHYAVFAGFAFIVGACVGSFLNVCVWRLPRQMNLLRPASKCPRCGNPIAWRDNIPVLGWILLGGRCRRCAEPISARYPLVEATVGLAFAAICLIELRNDPLEYGLWSALGRIAFHLTAFSVFVTVALIHHDGRRAVRDGSISAPSGDRRVASLVYGVGAVLSAIAAPSAVSLGDFVGGALSLGLFCTFLRRFFSIELSSLPASSTAHGRSLSLTRDRR